MKKTIAILLALCLCVSLSACGSKRIEDMIAKYVPGASAAEVIEIYGEPDSALGDAGEDYNYDEYLSDMAAAGREPISEAFYKLSDGVYTNISCGDATLCMYFSSTTGTETNMDRLVFYYRQDGEGAFTQKELDDAQAAFTAVYSHLKSLYGEPKDLSGENHSGNVYAFQATTKSGESLTMRLHDSTDPSVWESNPDYYRLYGLVSIYCRGNS